MSQVLGDLDPDNPMDVPTMMKMLMVVYENVRDDEIMEEVAEAVGDAICVLGDMRKVAHQVMLEGPAEPEFSHLHSCEGDRNLC